MHEIWADRSFERELANLPKSEQEQVLGAIKRYRDGHQVDVRPLEGAPRGSIRMRAGPYRILAIILEEQGIILLTSLFRKKRPADYARAQDRHRSRVAAYLRANDEGAHNP